MFPLSPVEREANLSSQFHDEFGFGISVYISLFVVRILTMWIWVFIGYLQERFFELSGGVQKRDTVQERHIWVFWHINIERNVYTWAEKMLSTCLTPSLERTGWAVRANVFISLHPASLPQGFMSCLALPAGSHTASAWKWWSFRCHSSVFWTLMQAEKPSCSTSSPTLPSL